MRPLTLSPETRARLEQIASTTGGFRAAVTGRVSDHVAQLFGDVAAADELAAVPPLADYLNSGEYVAAEAGHAIRLIMADRSPEDIARVDELCRLHQCGNLPLYRWSLIKPGDVRRIAARDDGPILGLLSCHPHGWVRGEAVKRLDRLRGGSELPFLILRANDWALPVRELAWTAIRQRLTPEYRDALVCNLGLIATLQNKTRANLSPLIGDIHGFLSSLPANLDAATGSENVRVRRAAYRLAFGLDDTQRFRFVKRGLGDNDSLVRLLAAQQAHSLPRGVRRDEVLGAMLEDRWHAIRLRGLRLIAAEPGDSTQPTLRRLVVDRSRSVRAAARFYLGRLGIDDFRITYAATIAGDRPLVGIQGIGECGTAEDLKLIEPFLQSTKPQLLAAAIEAIGRLNPDGADSLMVEMLTHDHRAPSNAAARRLKGRVGPATEQGIAAVFRDPHLPEHARRNALKLLDKTGKWDRLIYWLHGVKSATPAISHHCHRGLRRWQLHFNRTFTQPGEDQVAELERLMKSPGFDELAVAPFLHSVLRGRTTITY